MAKKRRSRSERDGLRVKLVTQIVDNWSLCKDFKVRAYPLCLCIWFCQHLNSLLGLSTDFVSKIEVVSSSDPGLCEPSSHLSSSIALLSSPTYHFPHPLEVPLNHRFLIVAAPLIFTQRRTESRTSILLHHYFTPPRTWHNHLHLKIPHVPFTPSSPLQSSFSQGAREYSNYHGAPC